MQAFVYAIKETLRVSCLPEMVVIADVVQLVVVPVAIRDYSRSVLSVRLIRTYSPI